MERKEKIIILGSSNMDMVVRTDHLPTHGETVLGGSFLMNPGGKGANQAVAVARMNGNLSFITKLGNDVFGEQLLEIYRKEKISTANILMDADNATGVALITVDKNGENCIAVASGANATFSTGDVRASEKLISEADFLLMQFEIPVEVVEYAARMASEKGVKVILNPAPMSEIPDLLFSYLYLITPNKTEAEMLSGIKINGWEEAEKAARIISSKGIDNVVLTLGDKGALVFENGRVSKVEAHKVDTVDTTAAGDTFNGVLCVGLSEGASLLDSVKMATKAAALAVTRMGAQSSIPYRNELDLLKL